jgi:hypothetical protein
MPCLLDHGTLDRQACLACLVFTPIYITRDYVPHAAVVLQDPQVVRFFDRKVCCVLFPMTGLLDTCKQQYRQQAHNPAGSINSAWHAMHAAHATPAVTMGQHHPINRYACHTAY